MRDWFDGRASCAVRERGGDRERGGVGCEVLRLRGQPQPHPGRHCSYHVPHWGHHVCITCACHITTTITCCLSLPSSSLPPSTPARQNRDGPQVTRERERKCLLMRTAEEQLGLVRGRGAGDASADRGARQLHLVQPLLQLLGSMPKPATPQAMSGAEMSAAEPIVFSQDNYAASPGSKRMPNWPTMGWPVLTQRCCDQAMETAEEACQMSLSNNRVYGTVWYTALHGRCILSQALLAVPVRAFSRESACKAEALCVVGCACGARCLVLIRDSGVCCHRRNRFRPGILKETNNQTFSKRLLPDEPPPARPQARQPRPRTSANTGSSAGGRKTAGMQW